MTKLRIVLAGLLIAALLAVGLPLTASGFYPPALYRVTVIVDDAHAGPGLTVRAYVGTETVPRAGAEAITNSGSVAIVQIPIMSGADLMPTRKSVRFTVEGADAEEMPDVHMTLEATAVTVRASSTPVSTKKTWTMPYGLNADPAAVNPWLYSGASDSAPLDGLETPSEVMVVWHYAGPAQGWQWFRPGWPESTLDMFETGRYYIGIASTACEWEIPLP